MMHLAAFSLHSYTSTGDDQCGKDCSLSSGCIPSLKISSFTPRRSPLNGASLFLSVLKLDACLVVSHGSSATLLGSPRHSWDWKKTQIGTDLKSPNWARKRQSKKSFSWELSQIWGDAWYIQLLKWRAAIAAACSFPVLLKGFGC